MEEFLNDSPEHKEGKEPVCLIPQTLCYALSFTLMQLSESVSSIHNLAVS